jgi:hypothetical protein
MARLIRRMFDRVSRTPSIRCRRRPPGRTAANLTARLLLVPLEQRTVPTTLAGGAHQTLSLASMVAVNPGATLTLGGPDTAAAGVTSVPWLTVSADGGPDRFVNVTNGGTLNVAAGDAVTVSGLTNLGGGTITVGANSQMSAADVQSYGTLHLAPGTDGVTRLTNAGTTDLAFNAGSRTFVSDVANIGNLNAGIDLNGHDAVVTGGLFVNNGFVVDSAGGTHTVVADAGALVKGAGFYQNPVVTQTGGRFQAGNSPGATNFGTFVFGPGGTSNYLWQINDATATAGPTPPPAPAPQEVRGWSLVRAVQQTVGTVTTPGDFGWTATPTSRLTVELMTLLAPAAVGADPLGPMEHFNPDAPHSWTLVTYVGTYTGPTSNAALNAATLFDTTRFQNTFGGSFGWNLDTTAKTLSLVYTPPTNFLVTATSDTGAGSGNSGDLRYVITQANLLGGRSAIAFSNSTAGGAVNFHDGTARIITLTSALPTVTSSVTITGPGADLLAVTANNTGRVLTISNPAATLDVSLSGMRLTGGTATADGGGGFVDNETVTLDGVWVQGNTTTASGGGIGAASGAVLTVRNSAVTANRAGGFGGGVGGTAAGTATVLVQGSTVSGNSAAGEGGGVGLGEFTQPGGLTVLNSTITANTAAGGGGIRMPGGAGAVTVQLTSSIVSGNAGPAGSPDVLANAVNAAHSAVGSTAGIANYVSDGSLPPGAALNLQPLALNGGTTPTHALGAGSQALNAGTNPAFLGTDQRGAGFVRTFGGDTDIGAYEAQAARVADVRVNDGAAQRSQVRSLTVVFSEPVALAGNPFTLTRVGGGAVGLIVGGPTLDPRGRTAVTLTFAAGAETDPVSDDNGGLPSLRDGRYRLGVADGAVTGASGLALDGDANGAAGGAFLSPQDTAGSGAGRFFGLYRLFGDATGNGVVDLTDLGQFRSTFNQTGPNPPNAAFLSFFDADNNNTIDLSDLGQFRSRFNQNLFA